jgi:integrase
VFRAFASALAGSQMKERSTGRQYRTTSRLAPIASRGVEHAKRVPSNAAALVFPEPFGNYWRALSLLSSGPSDKPVYRRRRFTIYGTRSPSTVRTPLPQLQKLLGHSSSLMTMRYMKHAPEAYFAEDAARVAASLQGAANPPVSEGLRRSPRRHRLA